MAQLLAKIHPPTYQEYVHEHRGQAQIYVRLKKALYGTLKAALLQTNFLLLSKLPHYSPKGTDSRPAEVVSTTIK